MSRKPLDGQLAFHVNNYFQQAGCTAAHQKNQKEPPIILAPSFTGSPSQSSPPSIAKNGLEQQMELLKEIKIRGGASRNLMFTKTEHNNAPKRHDARVERREICIDDKGTNTKTKATTELNSGQEPSSQMPNPPQNPIKKMPIIPPAGLNMFSPRNYLYKIGIQKTNRMLFQALNCSTRDCLVCNKNKGLRNIIKENLKKKYIPSQDTYNSKVITELVYNENTHIVVTFKDYLIYDEITEFLKRSYAYSESTNRLSKILDYYNKYSKVFPNYAVIQERKHMFNNIEWKQHAIDEKYKYLHDNKKKKTNNNPDESVENKIFTTGFLHDLNKTDSILGQSHNIDSNNHSDNEDSFGESSFYKKESNTRIQNYIKTQETIRKNGKYDKSHYEQNQYETTNLQELVDKFILKDSQSCINQPSEIQPSPIENKNGQCTIQIKKSDNLSNKHKVLEIAIGSKKVVLQHIPVLDKIKEKVKHARTKSHNNVSTQPVQTSTIKPPLELFPFSCKHAEGPEKVTMSPKLDSKTARPSSASRNKEVFSSMKFEKGGITATTQKSMIKTITPNCIAQDIRSKSHGKLGCGEIRKKSTGRTSQASARETENQQKTETKKMAFKGVLKQKDENLINKEPKKLAANASIKSPTACEKPTKHNIEKNKNIRKSTELKENKEKLTLDDKKSKIRLAIQIPHTARNKNDDGSAQIPPQLNANLMLSLGIRSPSAALISNNMPQTVHLRAATAMGLPKNDSKPKPHKELAIDVEEANKNMQVQEIDLETKTFMNAAETCKNVPTKKYGNNRTPDPSHRRFKSSYLNNLNAKIIPQGDHVACDIVEAPLIAQNSNANPILLPSKSLENLRKSTEKSVPKPRPIRKHSESINQVPQNVGNIISPSVQHEKSERKVYKRVDNNGDKKIEQRKSTGKTPNSARQNSKLQPRNTLCI